jgi:LacI family transcriptional regulator
MRIVASYHPVRAETFPRFFMDVNSDTLGQRRQRAPTIVDIAEAAGVSKTTVSRVLNGSARVAPATRSRVRDAIAELGFQVNLAARSLRTSRTGLVGLLVPVISIFGLIVESLDRQLAEHGLGVLLTSSRRRDPARDLDAVETLVGRGVDALVLAPSDDRSPELARYLRTLRTPIILLDREVRGLACDAVLLDHAPALAEAVRHLVGQGRRTLGLITRDDRTRPGRELVAGFRAACSAAGLPPSSSHVSQFVDLDRPAAHSGVDELLARGVDAILATGTLALTAGILERLAQHSISVPQELALVTWGPAGPESVETELPTIAYPVEEVARVTARFVLSRIEGSTAPSRVELTRTLFVPGGVSLLAAAGRA